MGIGSKIKVAVWGAAPPTKEEKKLLFKLDFFILSFCCLAFVLFWMRWNIMKRISDAVKQVLFQLSRQSEH